ncbi:hypothetical protein ABVN23_10165 [Pseudomonas fluorescens]|uniref:hypothetical protein n=1 Tax=Pseudomonas fluorescens TaxID=294 RepID=UPI003F9A146A
MSEWNPPSLTDLVAVDGSETVARALYPPEWDENVRRGSPGCFKRNNTSVTRVKTMSFEQLLARLKGDVERPGSTVVVRAVGVVKVDEIKEIGRANQNPVHFEVWKKPTDNNPEHAEIFPYNCAAQAHPNKEVPRGLSRQLSNALSLTLVTPDGEVEGHNPPL